MVYYPSNLTKRRFSVTKSLYSCGFVDSQNTANIYIAVLRFDLSRLFVQSFCAILILFISALAKTSELDADLSEAVVMEQIKTKRLLLTAANKNDLLGLEEIEKECDEYFKFDPPCAAEHNRSLRECLAMGDIIPCVSQESYIRDIIGEKTGVKRNLF